MGLTKKPAPLQRATSAEVLRLAAEADLLAAQPQTPPPAPSPAAGAFGVCSGSSGSVAAAADAAAEAAAAAAASAPPPAWLASPWSLRFRAPALEAAYRRDYGAARAATHDRQGAAVYFGMVRCCVLACLLS